MMRVKVERVREGQHPSEVLVSIATADGSKEWVIVDQRSLRGDLLCGYPVGEDGDRLLVELPQETLSGSWRVWVNKNLVQEDLVA